MQIRLSLDEDAMSRSLARELRARGVDVTTTITEGRLGQGDIVQLEFAKAQDRVIFSYNVGDYYHLHTQYLTEGSKCCRVLKQLAHTRLHPIPASPPD